MIRNLTAAAVVLLAVVAAVGGASAVASPALPADPVHTLTVAGTDVTMYPAFSPGIERYGVRTSANTGGTISVTASTTDPTGLITINGRPATSGVPVEVTGLTGGDEVAVRIHDTAGTEVHALVYLPSTFPVMTATSTGAGPSGGDVALTLGNFLGGPAFETIVDRNGVPSYLNQIQGSADLKVQPDGHYSVARAITGGFRIDELDDQFSTIRSYQMVDGAGVADSHDSIIEPDGTAYLVAYVANPMTQNLDAVIQEQNAAGDVLFQWDSADHVNPNEGLVPRSAADYAHINSIEIMPGGDIIASFRNLSQVMRIATTAHDGFAVGDVVWKLGGLQNQFTFPNDPDGGPCAQHSARVLANGDLLIYDDGSEDDPMAPPPLGSQTANMCPDPNNPTGPRIARPQSRAVEYSLNLATMTATLVWSYQPTGRYSEFAGSVQRLSGGNTLIGWSDATPDVSEVDAAGNEVWSLDVPSDFSYRVWDVPARDGIDPTVKIDGPANGTVVAPGTRLLANYGCTDRGGSTLQTCSGTVPSGQPLDTSTPGTHTLTVFATDGAGNTATASAPYTVVASPPTAPRSLVATAEKAAVSLAWHAPASAGSSPIANYRVLRSTDLKTWILVRSPTTLNYTSSGLTPRTRYYFRIQAVSAAGISPVSNTANAVPYTTPTAPRTLVARPAHRAVALTWLAPVSNGWSPITNYRVLRSTDLKTWILVRSPTTLSYTSSGLTPRTRYYFRIQAVNAAGVSPVSNTANAAAGG